MSITQEQTQGHKFSHWTAVFALDHSSEIEEVERGIEFLETEQGDHESEWIAYSYGDESELEEMPKGKEVNELVQELETLIEEIREIQNEGDWRADNWYIAR